MNSRLMAQAGILEPPCLDGGDAAFEKAAVERSEAEDACREYDIEREEEPPKRTRSARRAKRKGEANADGGHRMYELLGDVLRVTIRLDQSNQIIERCEIVLTAPAGMSYGTSEYNDFVTSGYHSYALLMAMHTAPTLRCAMGWSPRSMTDCLRAREPMPRRWGSIPLTARVRTTWRPSPLKTPWPQRRSHRPRPTARRRRRKASTRRKEAWPDDGR